MLVKGDLPIFLGFVMRWKRPGTPLYSVSMAAVTDLPRKS